METPISITHLLPSPQCAQAREAAEDRRGRVSGRTSPEPAVSCDALRRRDATQRGIWRFPKMRIPPEIIHFGLGFSLTSKPSIARLGFPHDEQETMGQLMGFSPGKR